MTVPWDLSPREFELRVQAILRDYARRIIEALGPNIAQCPCDSIVFNDGVLEIMYDVGSAVPIPIDPMTDGIMREAFDEIHELWQQQYPGIEFEIEDEAGMVHLCIDLSGVPFKEPQPPVGGFRATDVTEDKLRELDDERIKSLPLEKYEVAAKCKASIIQILNERETRGLENDFDWLEIIIE